MTEKDPTYLEQRLALYGIGPDVNETSIDRSNHNPGQESFRIEPAKWFDQDPEGNIQILFKELDNRPLHLRTGATKNVRQIFRTCLSPANRIRSEKMGKPAKYLQPAGTPSIIFHTQGIIDAYLNREKVETLYLVEGEFKAFTAWMHSAMWEPTAAMRTREPGLPPDTGLPIMGLTGIWNFRDEDKELHPDILEFIRVCDPENIQFIFDADLKDLPKGYDPERDTTKDLATRLKSFHDAIKTFRELAKGRVKDIYITWISRSMMDKMIPGTEEPVKGLDDLFALNEIKPTVQLFNLVKSIRAKTSKEYFESFNISAEGPEAIKKEFFLKLLKGGPYYFYQEYQNILQEHEFTFLGSRYRYDPDQGNVRMTVHRESQKYVRVSAKYYKMVEFPDAYGNTVRQLIPWAKAEIKEDFPHVKNFLTTIPKYDKFVNIPENDPAKYQQIIGNCFNLYYPMDHDLKPGKWNTIKDFLLHIFQDQFNVGMDWIYQAYIHPIQKLPAICLVSKEKGTGKSKFIELLVAIFQDNAVMIGNQEIGDRFNDDYVTKNVIGIDEGLIEKKATVEKMKSWITGRSVQMDTKNVNRIRVDMFAKLVLTSNNVADFIRIDDDEARFWVRYVKPFEGKEVPDLLDRMTKEIPAFLHYLKNDHQLTYQTRTRLYFHAEDYETHALAKLRDESHSQLYKNIKITLSEKFIEYNSRPGQKDRFTRLYYTVTQLTELIYGRSANSERQYVQKCLTYEFGMDVAAKVRSVKMPELQINPSAGEHDAEEIYVPGKAIANRWLEFQIQDFLTEAELKEMNVDPDKLTHDEQDPELPF